MGQEQSVPAPRRAPNKLSKPRTNSTANLLSRSNLQLDVRETQLKNVSSANLQSSPQVSEEPLGESLKPEKKSKRRSLFRSRTTQEKAHQVLETYTENYEVPEPSPVERPAHRWSNRGWSRNNSMTDAAAVEHIQAQKEVARPVNRSRMSLQSVPFSQHPPDPFLNAPEVIPRDTKPFIERRQSFYNQEANMSQIPGQLTTGDDPDTEIYGPIRRRSLLQHGVATRPSLITKNSRQSLPVKFQNPEDLRNYYYNPAKPTSSPLAYLASSGQDLPRVETPNSMDYGHIGAFKLGSLRITNGVASPSPSIERAVTMGAEDDYMSVGLARRTLEAQHRRGISNRSNTMSAVGESVKAQWAAHLESPLRQTNETSYEYSPLSKDMALPPLDPSLALFDFDTTQGLFMKSDSPTRSQEIANEYIQDLALSPYSFAPSRSASPVFEATSKNTAIDDELFDAEPSTPSLSQKDSAFGGSVNGHIGPKGPREKPLAKADSGYSSNISLRSFKPNGSRVPPAVPAKEPPPAPPKEPISRVPSSAYSFQSTTTDSSARTLQSLPSLPQETLPISVQSFDRASPVPLKHSDVRSSGRDSAAPNPPTKSPEQVYAAAQSRPYIIVHPQQKQRQNSLPATMRPEVQAKTLLNHHMGSQLNTDKRGRPRSMQPQTSVATPIYTVQAHGEHMTAPPVSYEASKRLENRVDSFPLNCFPNTFNGLRRSSSKETLGTIFSVGSGYTDIPVRQEITASRLQSALPSPPPLQRKPLNTMNSYQPPISPPKRLKKRSFSRERSPLSEDEFEDQLTISKRRGSNNEVPMAESRDPSNRNISGDSWTSRVTASTMVTARRSFDSIARGNPFDSRSSSAEHVPTMAQMNHPQSAQSAQSLRGQYLTAEDDQDERRLSWLARDKKAKSPPPVSMQTRKVTPKPHSSIPPTQQPEASLVPDSYPPQPTRAPPPPTLLKSPLILQQMSWIQSPDPIDQWTEQSYFQIDRTNNTVETLKSNNRDSTSTLRSRRSVEPRRAPPSAHQNAQLKMRKSLDVVRARQYVGSQFVSSPKIRSYESFDNSQRLSSQEHTYTDLNARNDEYNHTYGRSSPNKENNSPSPTKEYYDSEPHEDYRLQQQLHKSQTSTEDMLILDRFSGGLGYSYEPGYGSGLGGSAGTRNVGRHTGGSKKSVDVSRGYELDFSDVPVILQRVRA